MSLGTPALTDLLRRLRGRGAAARRSRARVAGAALLGAALLSGGGCAYYNTFFHAKKNYAKAQRIEESSKTDRLSPEAIKCYDEAIERCQKVIVDYEGGWRAGVDDALLLMGKCYYGKREYETAIAQFDALVLNYPDSDLVAEALFFTGLCYNRLRNFATADQIFSSLLAEHPRFARQDEILFIAAEGLESADDPAGALRQYGRLLQSFPKSRQREGALERVGEIHFEAGRFDSALTAYAELARTSQDDQVYLEAQFRRGACLVRLGRGEEALSVYERILPENPDKEETGARVWLAMADAYNRTARYEEALEKLGLVTQHFESRPQAIEAYYMTGYTHEVYLRDYPEAEKAYQKCAEDRGRSVFRDQAARRLENLKYLQQLSQEADSVQTDQDTRALAALKVAEFTLLESQDPQTALGQYADVVRDFPGTEAALRAAFAHGWILSREPDSAGPAAEVLQSLIDEHPESGQAEGALTLLRELGLSAERLAPLDSLVSRARAVERARADSAAAVAAEAAAEAARAAKAAADSVRTTKGRADSLRAASSARRSGRGAAPGDSAAAGLPLGPGPGMGVEGPAGIPGSGAPPDSLAGLDRPAGVFPAAEDSLGAGMRPDSAAVAPQPGPPPGASAVGPVQPNARGGPGAPGDSAQPGLPPAVRPAGGPGDPGAALGDSVASPGAADDSASVHEGGTP